MRNGVYDTRYFVEYFYSGDLEKTKALKSVAREVGEKLVSSVTIHEFYRVNVLKSGRDAAQLRCSAIKNEFKVIDLDYEQAVLSAEIRSRTPMPLADSVIAAIAVSRGCPVVSDDEHFSKVKGLKVHWPLN
jgi:predicted nucleic acid-binding protein